MMLRKGCGDAAVVPHIQSDRLASERSVMQNSDARLVFDVNLPLNLPSALTCLQL
jgi:hypothetical protein